MYSAYKLNKQGDIYSLSVLNIYTPLNCFEHIYSFLSFEPASCSMSGFEVFFLTCRQVSQETGKVVWYSHLFKNSPQFVVIHTVKSLSIVNEAEEDVFLEFPCFLYDPMSVGNLISGSFAFSRPSLYTWKFLVHVLLKPSLKDFEHNLTSMRNEHSCTAVWTFFDIALLWDWNENYLFQSCGHCWIFHISDILGVALC